MDSNAPRVHPQHALAAYAESLATDARVAVFGDASLGLAERLVELGARVVHVWDPAPGRAREAAESATRGITIRVYSEHDPDLRPIDLAIVADLGLFDDAAAIVRRVRRMVGEEGVAIVAAKSAESAARAGGDDGGARAFDYYDLFDLVAPEFDTVRMIAQLPFLGVAFVELSDEDDHPGVNVDTQLAESGRPPETFVVLASQRDVRLEPYAIVQLPSSAFPAPAATAPSVRDARLEAATVERETLARQERETLARVERETVARQERETLARQESETLAREGREAVARQERETLARVERETLAREAREAVARVEREALAREALAREALGREAAAEREAFTRKFAERETLAREERDALSREALSREAAARDALAQSHLRAELLASQLEDLRNRLSEGERAAAAVSALEEALRVRSSRAAELEKGFAGRGRELVELSTEVEEMRAAAEAGRIAAAQVSEVALRADRAERRAVALEQEVAKGSESHPKELAELEQALRERARAVRSLEGELQRREQLVRDLVGTLEDLQSPENGAGEPVPVAESLVPAIASPDPALAEENARLRAQLDALALDLARREGDAQASAWQIAELERRLAQGLEQGVEPEAPPIRIDRRLASALDELDTLRTALSQEHEARAKAESGEELARARAEIERQAVLMQQLVRELGPRAPSGFDRASPGSGDVPAGSSEDSR